MDVAAVMSLIGLCFDALSLNFGCNHLSFFGAGNANFGNEKQAYNIMFSMEGDSLDSLEYNQTLNKMSITR